MSDLGSSLPELFSTQHSSSEAEFSVLLQVASLRLKGLHNETEAGIVSVVPLPGQTVLLIIREKCEGIGGILSPS